MSAINAAGMKQRQIKINAHKETYIQPAGIMAEDIVTGEQCQILKYFYVTNLPWCGIKLQRNGVGRVKSEFERIYNEYSSGICGFLYKLCGSASLAEELTQETFYQAWKSLHRYNGSCELFTWLAAIAKNTYFKYLRKHKREYLRCDISEIDGMLADPDERPESITEKHELREAVMRAVMNLGDKYRDVTVLRVYADLSFAAIAELLGITENSAKVIFHRAKRQLETDLRRSGYLEH